MRLGVQQTAASTILALGVAAQNMPTGPAVPPLPSVSGDQAAITTLKQDLSCYNWSAALTDSDSVRFLDNNQKTYFLAQLRLNISNNFLYNTHSMGCLSPAGTNNSSDNKFQARDPILRDGVKSPKINT